MSRGRPQTVTRLSGAEVEALPVVDEDGRYRGVISTRQLERALADSRPETVVPERIFLNDAAVDRRTRPGRSTSTNGPNSTVGRPIAAGLTPRSLQTMARQAHSRGHSLLGARGARGRLSSGRAQPHAGARTAPPAGPDMG